MSKVKQVIEHLSSFQLLDSPNDYDYYLPENFSKSSAYTKILSDVEKVNNDFYIVSRDKVEEIINGR